MLVPTRQQLNNPPLGLLDPQDSQRWGCNLTARALAITDAKNTAEIPQVHFQVHYR